MFITGIAGGPKTGKTTLAQSIGHDTGSIVIHMDDKTDLPWSEQSQYFADRLFKMRNSQTQSDIVIEGVALARTLRKWLKLFPGSDKPPVDKLIILEEVHEDLSSGQQRMASGHDTILSEVLIPLQKRGVEVVYQ